MTSSRRAAPRASHACREREIGARADLVIAIGGDGTLLYAARLVAAARRAAARGQSRAARVPHRRHAAGHAALGRCRARRRACRGRSAPAAAARGCTARTAPLAQALALNDVVMQKHDTGRMLDFETRIDGRYVNTHDGDGIIVASRHRLDRLRALLRRPDHRAAPAGAGDRADLPAHAVRPPDRGVRAARVIEVRLLERPTRARNVTCDGTVLGAHRAGRPPGGQDRRASA